MQITIALRKLFITIIFFMPILIIIFGFLHTKSIIGLSILLFLYGITIGFAPPLFSTIISNEYNENRGAALGLFNFIRYSGMAVGGMFTGLNRLIPSSYIFFFFGCVTFSYFTISVFKFKKENFVTKVDKF